jgi:hypothetical protein
MACCAAIAFVFAVVRTAWSRILGRGPVAEEFPPGATWRAATVVAPAAAPKAVVRASLGGTLAVTVLAYGLLVHLLVAAGLAELGSVGGWLLRDAVLGCVALILMLVGRGRAPTASVLVAAGLLWFAVGVADMHAFSAFEFRTVPLALDLAFHLSGWWLAIAAAAIVVVQRRTDTFPLGDLA